MTYSNINLDDLTNGEVRELATALIEKILELEQRLANAEQKLVCLQELLKENDIKTEGCKE